MPFKLKPATPIGSGLISFRGFGTFEDPQLIPTITNGTLSLAISSGHPGDYYTAAPTITITDRNGTVSAPPNVTATATAGVSGGLITGTTITAAGHFYTSVPAIAVGAVPGATNGALTAVLGPVGNVTAITITNAGTGYTAAPTLTFDNPPPVIQPTATAVLGGGYLIYIAVGGTNIGYTSAPAVTFTGGGGTGAAATCDMDLVAGTVLRFNITNPGQNYTSAPTVVLTGGGYVSIATGTAMIAAKVASISGVAGFGYTSTPLVSVAAPQVVIVKPNCWTISQVFPFVPVSTVAAATDLLQWTLPGITADGSFDGSQFGKSMLLANNGSGNAIVAVTRTAATLTRGLGFSGGWTGN